MSQSKKGSHTHAAGAPEGTAVLSTTNGNEAATKFLRADGDGTCSWVVPSGSGDVSKVGTPVDNQVGVWTGNGTIEGTSGLVFDGTNLEVGAGGTFTTASGNDLNLVYPDTRSLFIKEGSTTHVTVDNAGLVGIGRTPTKLLDVYSTGNGEVNVERASGAAILTQAQAALGKFGTTSNHSLQLMANNTGYLTITAAGNVGIGTTDPSYALHVASTAGYLAYFQNTSATDYRPIGFTDDQNIVRGTIGVNTTTNEFQLGDATGTSMFLNGGNVGIGAAPVGYKLEVTEGTANEMIRISGANSAGLTFRNSTANEFILYTGTSDALIFGTNGNNPRMTITNTGNVGIGTGSSVGDLLEVSGAGRSIGTGTNYNVAKFESTTTNKGGIMLGGSSYGVNDSGVIFPSTSTGSLNLNVGNGGDTQGITITSAGLVGIGTAVPNFPVNIYGDSTDLAGLVLRNTNATVGDKLKIGFDAAWQSATEYGSYVGVEAMSVSGGSRAEDMIFGVRNQSEDASDPIERLRITSTGNVGIGDEDPASALSVVKSDTTTGVTSSGNGGPQITLQNTSDTDGNFASTDYYNSSGFMTGRIGAVFVDAGDRNTDLFFATRANGGALTEQMRITSTGTITGGGVKTYGGVISHGSLDSSSVTICGGTSSATTGANITLGGNSGSADREVIFKSNATPTMRISSAGLVGIGGVATSRKLELHSSGGTGIKLVSEHARDFSLLANSVGFSVFDETNGYRLVVDTDGRVTVKKSSNSEITELSSSSNSTAVDMNAADNFRLALAENTTLAQPSNITAGQSGAIVITQDGTGSRTMAYNAYWHFEGGTAPTLSTAGGSVDTLVYYVASTTSIHAVLLKDIKTT